FFFSSRRRHTRCLSDWSSDVCSSDLATVGWFDLASKTYRNIPVAEQCEVLSGIGDIAIGDDGKPSLHVHAVLGLSDGSTRGGHLLEGHACPTLEVTLIEMPAHLRRKKRPDIGIASIGLGASD